MIIAWDGQHASAAPIFLKTVFDVVCFYLSVCNVHAVPFENVWQFIWYIEFICRSFERQFASTANAHRMNGKKQNHL